MQPSTEEQFAELFRGRLDAYGTDQGGCDKVTEGYTEAGWSWEGEYQRRITAHLWGQTPMGVYPLTNDCTVTWGCTDLDYTNDPTDALNIETMLQAAGINAFVEVSRSKGFHVWTFADDWVPAATMRNALLAVHQMLDIPPTEINPKQVSLEGLKGYGNYVRLPYPGALMHNGHTENHRQCVFGPDGDNLTVYDFVGMAHASRTPFHQYQALADMYVPPPPPKTVIIDRDIEPASRARLVTQMSRGTYLAYEHGPRPGHDRSSSLARLAHLMCADGLSATDAMYALVDADLRWGKFHLRPDGDAQLERMITRAYE